MLQRLADRMRAFASRVFSFGRVLNAVIGVVAVYLLVTIVLGIYWSNEPDMFDVSAEAQRQAEANQQEVVPGYTTTATAIHLLDTMLNKPGGFISNDRFPPGLWMDNTPNWEYGVLIQMRDFSQEMRRGFSRSQSQSTEDPDLVKAQPQLNFDNHSWIFPSSESAYNKALEAFQRYEVRLGNPDDHSADFYARADNLNDWLGDVSSRLGSLSQRLSASVGQKVLPGEAAPGSELNGTEIVDNEMKTPWSKVDDVFYEARGTTWALLHLLKAVQVDFAPVLEKKEAEVSLQQIIRELEATQKTMWSPVILNGSEFGFMANYSLVMANYISRANAAIIDLRALLANG